MGNYQESLFAAVNNMLSNCWSLPYRKSNKGFPCLCWRATKYFLELWTMYLSLHVDCQILLSDFNQIWSFWTDFRVSPQQHISRKFAQWQKRQYMRRYEKTDGGTWRNYQTFLLFMRRRLTKKRWVSLERRIEILRTKCNVVPVLSLAPHHEDVWWKGSTDPFVLKGGNT